MDILIMRASTNILANDTLFFPLRVVKIVGIGKNPVMLLNVYQHGKIVLQEKLEENTLRMKPRIFQSLMLKNMYQDIYIF